jgi:hypothetical protein
MNLKNGIASVSGLDVAVRAVVAAVIAGAYIAATDVTAIRASVTMGAAFLVSLAMLAVQRARKG